MSLSIICTWDEATVYLNELISTLQGDVRPLLQTGNDPSGSPANGAPFAICREVFCLVDHLGCLYTGLVGPGDVGTRFRRFLSEVMPDGYRKRAWEIYNMYRNGPVHEFCPKTLENRQGQLLVWAFLKNELPDEVLRASHLQVEAAGEILTREGVQKPLHQLRVSTRLLLDDLEAAIQALGTMPSPDERITLWNRAARELTQPRPYDFKIRQVRS